DGNSTTVDGEYFRFGYDTSILHKQKDIVLDVTFQLSQKPKSEIKSVMEANREWRKTKQPQLPDFPSCGSVFKKIEDIGAGRLIEQAGLKGMRIGDAEISRKHANFIVNLGNAKANDVLALIQYTQKTVKEKSGYSLDTEIMVVGEP
ncbi:MAG: UDP-N-acetylenolpyruvoylglucosamine reductase, partial [Candidatus Kuenenia sp.]|nr:UDP-N-acetylenolpyruvoylglucosamine reductase [Candidatus Kuenenia sp.]